MRVINGAGSSLGFQRSARITKSEVAMVSIDLRSAAATESAAEYAVLGFLTVAARRADRAESVGR